ncbi:GntR family transcriptional regulator [Streptomyces lunaelactis]|uniref:GntR family transcriptional regulator n=1 Tax=Streptomyces lunaelactis TaxID=1535768 RepID=A0A2R4SW84_9ACTN|nr:GntR family transcriptional regulator [Streptomyces lunaelactis]AVZ71112.1 GntR family transcriptional regulator [Streptomyces lunaelactis]NUK22767.1 GntR family transcriptional regulator [Streptomyces lunaelactis]NUK85025.1 GntR family transcriptional regulator [Streptomyces lunaelactis]
MNGSPQPRGDRSHQAFTRGRLPQNSHLPPYRLLADDLRRQILDGHLKPGEQLPPSRALQDQYRIANMTARSAVRILRDEGLVYTTHGRGSFVADPLPARPVPDHTHPHRRDPAPRMPTQEYTELSCRIQEIADRQNTLLRYLRQAGSTDRLHPHLA